VVLFRGDNQDTKQTDQARCDRGVAGARLEREGTEQQEQSRCPYPKRDRKTVSKGLTRSAPLCRRRSESGQLTLVGTCGDT
jgi:hypothetical protein